MSVFFVIKMRLRPLFCSRRFQKPCQTPITTNTMAECCDVMVAHSPPLFSAHNSPPELSVLYQNFRRVMTQKQQSPLSVRRFSNAARSSGSPTRENRQGGSAKPRRPCLVIRTDSDGSIGSSSSGSSSDENEPSSPTRRKKKVVFADDRGLSLTQVSNTFIYIPGMKIEGLALNTRRF